MNKLEFKYLIEEANYTTKYEAIIDTNNGSIYGFEALSRFEIDQELISTEEIFRKLHHNNDFFFELEKRNKEHQVDNYFENKKLFLNFDADIVHSYEQKEYWEFFLKSHKENVVVEITENGSDDEKSTEIIHDFSSWLKDKGIDYALDDFEQDGSMFSFYLMDRSRYIKIDKSYLAQIKKNPAYMEYLKGLIKTIKINEQKSIIEGVETYDDYLLAKELKIDFMQGYYFSDLTVIR